MACTETGNISIEYLAWQQNLRLMKRKEDNEQNERGEQQEQRPA